MGFVDISMPLGPRTPAYPGDTTFGRREQRSLRQGDDLTLSELTLSAHAGTHVDAPSHFLPDGATVSDLAVGAYSGPATVLDVRGASHVVHAHNLRAHAFEEGDIVLLETRNSRRWQRGRFFEDYIYLSEGGARLLADRGVKAVGIDSLSIEGFHVEGHPAHRLLLGRGIGIIEGLDLSSVEPGRYWLACFPLRVIDGDGAPVRAVLIEETPSA